MTVLAPPVNPKSIPVKNAWYLLLYAWDLARWKDRWSSGSEAYPDLLGLLVRVLVDCTSDLLRYQLARQHHVAVREIAGVRGRIDFAASLKRRSFDAGRATCAFPELTIDTLRNRLIRGTLRRLLTDERLDVGAPSEHAHLLRHDLRVVLNRMEGVTATRVQAADFDRIQHGRNDEEYRLPLEICHIISKCEIPAEAAGNNVMTALVRDEIAFSKVFERFVRNFLQERLHGATVKSEQLTWPGSPSGGFVPSMLTDITIDWPAPNRRRLVIDTKYYTETLSSRPGRPDKFHSANLYQMYAYLRTQEDRGEPFLSAAGALLYPTTSVSLDERMNVQGHEMRIATVDLAKPWQEIEAKLLRIGKGLD